MYFNIIFDTGWFSALTIGISEADRDTGWLKLGQRCLLVSPVIICLVIELIFVVRRIYTAEKFNFQFLFFYEFILIGKICKYILKETFLALSFSNVNSHLRRFVSLRPSTFFHRFFKINTWIFLFHFLEAYNLPNAIYTHIM